MPEITYFYVDPSGGVRENPSNLPLELLERRHEGDGTFRFAFDAKNDKFYIQDPSYRRKLADGDRDAWKCVNESLRFLKEERGAGFLSRSYGDPPGSSIKRLLSDYKMAWEYLGDFLQKELSERPVNFVVCEFVPTSDGIPDVSIEGPGIVCEGRKLEEPCVMLNRYLHRNSGGKENVSYSLLNEALAQFYLDNVGKISQAFLDGENGARLEAKMKKYEDYFGYELMFAASGADGVKIFKSHKLPDDDIPDEMELRRNGLSGADHVVLFSYVPKEKRIVFYNYTPTEMGQHEELKEILDEIVKLAARSTDASEKDLVLSFDPAMSSPFLSTLKRYRALWEIAENRAGKMTNVPVLEIPVNVRDGAKILRSSREEEKVAPKSRDYRVKHGIEIEYPVMLVDNRTDNMGLKFRAMLGAYSEFRGESLEPADTDQVKKEMKFLMHLGMPRRDVLDFYASRAEMSRRAKFFHVLKEVANERFEKRASREAAIGPGLDINDWSEVGLQEELNRSKHVNDKRNKGAEPFNLRKKKPSSQKPYEGLLNAQRDKDMNYMKSTEQLLRESRI